MTKKEQRELAALQLIEQLTALPDALLFWYVSPNQYEPDCGPVADLLKPRMTRHEIESFEATTGIRTHIQTWSHEEPDDSGNPPPAMLPLVVRWNDPQANRN